VRPRIRLDTGALLRRLPAFLLVLIVAIPLAWAIVRSALVNQFARSNPLVAARIAPDDPRVVMGLVALDMRKRMGLVGPTTKAEARRALVRAPLLEEPFTLSGLDLLLRKDNRGARRMLSHALARNPRSRIARLFMLEVELRAGAVDRAALDMAILSRLLPDVQKVFVPELARLARDPQTTTALQRTLRADPRLLNQVLQHLAANGSRPELVLRLAGSPLVPVTDLDPADWRQTLLGAMVARGDVTRAYRLWTSFSGMKPGAAVPGVYDGDFSGSPGLPPFNWNFASSEMGAAERDRKGGLQVEYYGRTAGDLATQLVVLAPGRYRISFHAEGDLSSPQHRLLWRMQCLGSNTMLFEFPLADITYAGRTLAGDFSVPGRCPAQWLKLVGAPTEFPKIENVLIRNLKIQRLGGPA